MIGSAPSRRSSPEHRAGRLVRNLAMLSGSQLTTWLFSLLWTIVVPRALGPAGMGQMVAALSATAILSTCLVLGTDTFLIKEIARDHGAAPRLLGGVIALRAALLIPGIALMAAFIHFARFDHPQVTVLWLATGGMAVSLFQSAIHDAFTGIERMEYLAYSAVLTNAIGVPVAVALVLVGYGVVALMVLGLCLGVAVLAISSLWLRRHLTVEWRVDLRVLRTLAVRSLPYWISGLFFTTYIWIDAVLLSVLTSSQQVGWYGVATRMLGILVVLATIPTTAWFPRLAATFTGGVEGFRQAVSPVLELVLGLSLPVGVGGALLAAHLVGLLYGPHFSGAIPILIILSLSVPATFLDIVAYQVLVASNRQTAWTWVMGGAVILNPALNLILIQYFQATAHNGGIGAALSLLVTEVAQAAVAAALLPWIFSAALVRRLARTAVATAGMAGTVWVTGPLGLFVQVGAGALAFVALALIVRLLSSAELQHLLIAGARMRRAFWLKGAAA